jgi:poly(A) polymerase
MPPRHAAIPLELIDPDAITVVRRLRRFGHRAYLVGGCVRDLLLGIAPKDFDVATDAKPEEIKSIFRNSRIIGRRFRLVHLYFRAGKIIEVSTFRARAQTETEDEGDDLIIRRDNVFGTEEEDALRRDFTINGLFYDVVDGRIIDHVGGLPDIEKRYLRMIGDPDIRLREDPVRILRAIRFWAKTGLQIDPVLEDAIRRHKEDLRLCAPARILEETLRLLRLGFAEKTVRSMESTGVLGILLPEIQAYLDEEPNGTSSHRDALYAHLAALDGFVERGPASDPVILGALLYAPLLHTLDSDGERSRALAEIIARIGARVSLTRRISEHMRQLFLAQRHLEKSNGHKKRRRIAPSALIRRAFFPDALNLYEIHLRATGAGLEDIADWHRKARDMGVIVEPPFPLDLAPSNGEPAEAEPKKKRRRRRRRRGEAGGVEGAPPE